jgi:hypothetical protein
MMFGEYEVVDGKESCRVFRVRKSVERMLMMMVGLVVVDVVEALTETVNASDLSRNRKRIPKYPKGGDKLSPPFQLRPRRYPESELRHNEAYSASSNPSVAEGGAVQALAC